MEIARALIIPPHPSSSSFSLRTKYNSILYKYEQIYFLRSDGIVESDNLRIPIQRITRERRRRSIAFTHPKRNRSGYVFYFVEQFLKMKPNTFRMGQELAKNIGYQWKHLSSSEKFVSMFTNIYIRIGDAIPSYNTMYVFLHIGLSRISVG